MGMYFLSEKAKQKKLKKKLWCVRKNNVISDSSNKEKQKQLKDTRIEQSSDN